MEEKIYHRDPPGQESPGKDAGQNKTRSPSHGRKLKNASSAKRAAGEKFRHGRADHGLSPEEERLLRKKKVSHKKAARAQSVVSRENHRKVDDANEDQNVGTEAANRAGEAAEAGINSGIRAAEDFSYRNKLKHVNEEPGGGVSSGFSCSDGSGTSASSSATPESGRAGSAAGAAGTSGRSRDSYSSKLAGTAKEARAKADAAASGGVNEMGGGTTRAVQKNFMKKEFQRAAVQNSQKEAAHSFGSMTKKFVDKTEDMAGRIGEWVVEHVSQHPVAVVIALVIVTVVLFVAGGSSSTHVLMNMFGSGTVASSYTAEDNDILTVDQNYKDLEAELAEKIASIERDYPGYDEYQYELAEIGHNPFELAALLTIIYEDYTPEEADEMLQEILDAQYELTTTPVTEIRTRTVEKTGTRTAIDEEGNEYQEEYTYEVEEQYEYHILKVKLTNESMEAVVQNVGLTEDQLSRYEILHETYGNKKYLFEDDIYANPDADGGGQGGGAAGEEYRPAGEALTDAQFAAMWNEASKYLGRAYVWGGSSPSTGFDCSGFVCWVINKSGAGSIGRTTAEGIRQWTNPISKSDRQPGDIIYFQGTYNTAGASHVGIYIGDGKMIHCGDPIKVSNVDSGYFANHFLGYGRIP